MPHQCLWPPFKCLRYNPLRSHTFPAQLITHATSSVSDHHALFRVGGNPCLQPQCTQRQNLRVPGTVSDTYLTAPLHGEPLSPSLPTRCLLLCFCMHKPGASIHSCFPCQTAGSIEIASVCSVHSP